MQISIKTIKGKNINLEVDDSSNTIDLKIHGEPMSELVLRLGPLPERRAAPIRIFVETLRGKSGTLEVKESDTIKKVKTKWKKIDGDPVEMQKMVFQGQELEDNRTVGEYNIKHESTIHVLLRLCGC